MGQALHQVLPHKAEKPFLPLRSHSLVEEKDTLQYDYGTTYAHLGFEESS